MLLFGDFLAKAKNERVLFDLIERGALIGIEGEHAADEMAQARGAAGVGREKQAAAAQGAKVFVHLAGRVAAKGEAAGGQHVQAHAQRPHVDLGPLVAVALPQFGGGIVQRAQVVAQALLAADEGAAVTKVAQVHAALVVQHVLQLEVFVDVAQAVHGLHRGQHLAEQREDALDGQRLQAARHRRNGHQVQQRARQVGHGHFDGCLTLPRFQHRHELREAREKRPYLHLSLCFGCSLHHFHSPVCAVSLDSVNRSGGTLTYQHF